MHTCYFRRLQIHRQKVVNEQEKTTKRRAPPAPTSSSSSSSSSWQAAETCTEPGKDLCSLYTCILGSSSQVAFYEPMTFALDASR